MDTPELPARFERERLLGAVKDRIRPEGTLEEKAYAIQGEIQSALDVTHPGAICVLGGSVAKGTYLRENHDVDFFVRFPAGSASGLVAEMLEESLSGVAKKLHVKLERLHGSRDYFQFRVDAVTFEIVPVIKIDHAYDAQNVTDVSPLHVEWVAKHTAGNPVLCDEIRLGKQFCKAAGIYGAESYISGFSGHVIDILTIHYGSFLKLLSAASSEWKRQVIVDPEQHLRDPLAQLNEAKIVSPLVLVDPVDDSRNAAAALSPEAFETFKRRAREFLSESAIAGAQPFFEIVEVTRDYAMQRKQEWAQKKEGAIGFVFHWQALQGKRDVVGAKLLKAHAQIERLFRDNEFTILESGWSFSLAYVIVDGETLPEFSELPGPPKAMEHAVAEFVKAHGKKAQVKGDRYIARIPRAHRTAGSLAKAVVLDGYIREKVEDLKLEALS